MNALLLGRKPFREYDEKIKLLTDELGVIQLIAFGTKSPNSKRGKMLSELGWLKIEISNNKGFFQLNKIYHFKPIITPTTTDQGLSSSNLDFYLDFSGFIKVTSKFLLPFDHETIGIEDNIKLHQPFFELLTIMSQPAIVAFEKNYRNLIFNFIFLHEHGALGGTTFCHGCQQNIEFNQAKSEKTYFFVKKQPSKLQPYTQKQAEQQGQFICEDCRHRLICPNSILIPLKTNHLFILQQFTRNYQLDITFIKRFYKFILAQDLDSQAIDQFKLLVEEYQNFIR